MLRGGTPPSDPFCQNDMRPGGLYTEGLAFECSGVHIQVRDQEEPYVSSAEVCCFIISGERV